MSKVGIAVNNVNGKLIIDFDQKTDHLEFEPQQAVDFAKAIVDKAIKAVEGHDVTSLILPQGMH